MPHLDGYELIRQVRALPEEEGGQVPAIALTAYARREDELKAFVAGYQVHVAKPVDARPARPDRRHPRRAACGASARTNAPGRDKRGRGARAGPARERSEHSRSSPCRGELVQGAPVRPHDVPRDRRERAPPRHRRRYRPRGRFPRIEGVRHSNLINVHVAPPSGHAKTTGRSGIPLERLREQIGDRLAIRSASHSPSRWPLSARWIVRPDARPASRRRPGRRSSRDSRGAARKEATLRCAGRDGARARRLSAARTGPARANEAALFVVRLPVDLDPPRFACVR